MKNWDISKIAIFTRDYSFGNYHVVGTPVTSSPLPPVCSSLKLALPYLLERMRLRRLQVILSLQNLLNDVLCHTVDHCKQLQTNFRITVRNKVKSQLLPFSRETSQFFGTMVQKISIHVLF